MTESRAAANQAVVQRLFDELWNGRNLDIVDELYAEAYVCDYRPYVPLRTGRDAVRAMVESAWQTSPDYHEELISMIAEDDRVAVHLRITGTQSGAWGPVPPTGKHLEFDEMLMLTFDDRGRVIHQRGIVDNLAGLRQAGVIPTA